MIARRIVLVAFTSCMVGVSASGQSPTDTFEYFAQGFFNAPINPVDGSTLQGNCVGFLAPGHNVFHLGCVGLQGGPPLTGVQLTNLDPDFGETSLVDLPFSGGPVFNHDIANPPAHTVRVLMDGALGIRFNSPTGQEGGGVFAPAPEARTFYNLLPIVGDRRGTCQLATVLSPPFVGGSCAHNVPGSFNFEVFRGTVDNRGPEIINVPFPGTSGNDVLSFLQPADSTLINFLNNESTNAHAFSTPAWAGGNNRPCHEGPTTLCLNNNRFNVTTQWANAQGQRGAGTVSNLSDESGLFYFFDPANWEMLVKVLDGCGTNNHFWVFAAAATNVEYTLTVTDTQSNATRTYSNSLGTQAPAITDTEAFATCP